MSMKPLESNGTQCQGQAAQYEEVLSIRQHTSAYVSIRQRIPLNSDGRQFQVDPVQYEDTSAYVSIRQHTSAYDGRQLQGGEASPYEAAHAEYNGPYVHSSSPDSPDDAAHAAMSSLTSMGFSQERVQVLQ
jgi:hypothetical protein